MLGDRAPLPRVLSTCRSPEDRVHIDDKPRIDRALLAEHANGLIALSACYSGEPSRAILEGTTSRWL
jgi:DNA polymerase III alpha subunit